MNRNNSFINNEIKNSNVNLRAELDKYLGNWKWYLICFILSIISGLLYLRYSTPQFEASSKIMIADNQKTELKALEDLGVMGSGSTNNLENEIEIIKSRKVLRKIILKLGLNTRFYVEGRIKKVEIYDRSPIKIFFLDSTQLNNIPEKTYISFDIDHSKNTFEITDVEGNKYTETYNKEIKLNNIPAFKVFKNVKNNKTVESYNKVYCAIEPIDKSIDILNKLIHVNNIGTNSNILTLSLKSAVLHKAELTLDSLVTAYNSEDIKDKNKVAKKTNEFITERLQNISKELAIVDDNVKDFKKKNKITNISSESELYLKTKAINREKLVSANTQLSLVKAIQEELNDKSETFLPANLGINDPNIARDINKYNDLITQINELRESAGSKNIVLINLNNNLNSLKKSLLVSLANQKKSLKITVDELNKEAGRFTSEISSIPLKERNFLDITRQQEIIAELYSYLLKKKEETEISLAANKIPNARIIDKAYASKKPVSPKKKTIFLIALILSLIFPTAFIYAKDLLDTKVHNRKDIENLTSIPFLGDIPHSKNKGNKVIISYNARSSSSEAFRLIRTNLDFLLSNTKNTKKGKTLFITSTISGEGKSFTSLNLAATLSLSGKKTILIGMDLRAPKITQYLGLPDRAGITNFLTNENTTLDDIKFSIPEIKNLTLISSGIIPPNPAELLMGDRIKNIFDELTNNYDYVLVDTAPISLVTDTLLISKYSDLVIYVTRAGYLDKRMLEIPQSLYSEKKLKNMAIVLNDTDINKGYGYGYGYGYGNIDEPWYKKIKFKY